MSTNQKYQGFSPKQATSASAAAISPTTPDSEVSRSAGTTPSSISCVERSCSPPSFSDSPLSGGVRLSTSSSRSNLRHKKSNLKKDFSPQARQPRRKVSFKLEDVFGRGAARPAKAAWRSKPPPPKEDYDAMFPALPSLGPSSTPSSGPGDGSPPPRRRVAVLGGPPGSRGQLVAAQDTNIMPVAATTSATSAEARHKNTSQSQPQTNPRPPKEDVPSAGPLTSTMPTLSAAPLTAEPPRPSSNAAGSHPRDDQKLALLQILNAPPLPPMPPHYGLLAAFGFELPLNPDQYPSPAFPEHKFDLFRENPWQHVPAAQKILRAFQFGTEGLDPSCILTLADIDDLSYEHKQPFVGLWLDSFVYTLCYLQNGIRRESELVPIFNKTINRLRDKLLLAKLFPDIPVYWKSDDGSFTTSCTLDEHENAYPVTTTWLEGSIASLERERAEVVDRLDMLTTKAQQRWLEMGQHIKQFFEELKCSVGGEYRHAKMIEAVEGNLRLILRFRPDGV